MNALLLLGYAGLTALGIAAVALVLQRTGLGARIAIGEDEAREAAEAAAGRALEDTPPFAADGTFLFKTKTGFVAVRPQGARVYARVIAPEEIKAVKPVKGGVKLVLRDYTDPALFLRTDDPEEARVFVEG